MDQPDLTMFSLTVAVEGEYAGEYRMPGDTFFATAIDAGYLCEHHRCDLTVIDVENVGHHVSHLDSVPRNPPEPPGQAKKAEAPAPQRDPPAAPPEHVKAGEDTTSAAPLAPAKDLPAPSAPIAAASGKPGLVEAPSPAPIEPKPTAPAPEPLTSTRRTPVRAPSSSRSPSGAQGE